LLSVAELPQLLNPKSGWLYNSNNAPWSAAGPSSPKKEDYPAYVGNKVARTCARPARGESSAEQKGFHDHTFLAAAYDSYLTWFDKPAASVNQSMG